MRLRAALRPAGGRPRRGTAALALACLLRALAGCGDEQPASVVTLDLRESIRNLAADDLDVSSAAEERLAAIGAPALPALHAALRREPEAVRLGIVQVLGEIRDDGAVAVLAAALGDPAEQVRADAAAALGQRSGAEAERAVIGAFGDGSELVRQRAALACVAACRSPAALDAVLRLALDDPAPEAGWAAVRSLVVLRGFDDPALGNALDGAIAAAAPGALERADASQRARAAVLLAALGDARGASVLEQAAGSPADQRVTLRVVYALGQVGGPSAVPVLRRLLADPRVAVYAHDALRRAATRGVSEAAAALEDYDGPSSPVPLPPPPW